MGSRPITIRELRAAVEDLGLDFSVTSLGSYYWEYRINLRTQDGGTEATSYYTTDRRDAMDTARAMASDRDGRALHRARLVN